MKDKVKFKPITTISIFIVFLLFTGCGKKAHESAFQIGSNRIEKPIPHKLKALKIGQAEAFALLAYDHITSNPNSSINGKVGLFPATREWITIEASEVLGGSANILGSDDDTNPINLLSNAKVDMVLAYKEAISITPDADKVGLSLGNSGRKILAPGCYNWNSDLLINDDITIEGSESDIWLFKIPANFKLSSGVHINLSGGAKAKNIFWQIAGSAVLENESVMVGTIFAQQSIELKARSILTGRAFAKNGYITLNQATVLKP